MELPDSLIEQTLGKGDVVHGEVFADIDHGKFFVLLGGKDGQIGYFFINSNINKWKQAREAYFLMQYPIKAADYSFLDYQSFVDCTAVHKIDRAQLARHLKSGKCQIVGRISKEDYNRMMEAAQASALFNRADKAAFLTPMD